MKRARDVRDQLEGLLERVEIDVMSNLSDNVAIRKVGRGWGGRGRRKGGREKEGEEREGERGGGGRERVGGKEGEGERKGGGRMEGR
jgi:hypothetical protein